ncbi:MAG: hypothetical protein LQ350_008067 [Teloschistes chrysophthalmus]|nr:MAG: hypothetical protein LQ350_008067 [Niorma chrysophthalma]
MPTAAPNSAPNTFAVNGISFLQGSGPGLVIGTQTVTPGADGITISRTRISLSPSGTAIVVDGSVIPVPGRPPNITPASDGFTANGSSFPRDPNSVIIIGTRTLIPGGGAVTISGTPISLPAAGNAVVVGGSTVSIYSPGITAPPTAGLLTLDGLTFSRGDGSDIILGSQTLRPGVPALTITGTPISLLPSGTAVDVGGSTIPIPTLRDAAASSPSDTLTIAGFTLTRGPQSNLILNGQTVTPGAPALQISGSPISLLASGTAIAVGSSTFPIPAAASPAPDTVTIGGFTFSRDSKSNLLLNGQTITPGAPAITVSGKPISLFPSATALAIGSATYPIPTPTAVTPSQDTFTIDGFTFTRGPQSDLIINGQTLTPGGPALTISGTPISLPASPTVVVINGVTDPLPPPLATPNTTAQPLVLNLNGQSYTELINSAFLIGSQTLVAGGAAITVGGTAVSLAEGATALEVGGTKVENVGTSVGVGGMVMSGFFSGVPGATGTGGAGGARKGEGVEASNVGSRRGGVGEWVFGVGLLLLVAVVGVVL